MVYRVDEMFDDQPTDTPYYAGDPIDLLGDELFDEIESMGYPPELMGGPFKRLIKRIRKRIKARRAKRAKKTAMAELGPEQAQVSPLPQFAFQTPRGGFSTGPGGMNITYPQAGPGFPVQVGPQQQPVAKAGMANPLEFIQKNPMLLAIPVGLFAMTMMMKKKRGGNGNGKK